MEWSYGVTTVEARIEDGLLKRTLDSLALAGFPAPHIFIDGLSTPPEWLSKSYRCTCHSPNVRTYGNWILGMWELILRQPNVDRYVMFQDDLVTYRNLRDYLDISPYPDKGYLNLYTFPENARLGFHKSGWYTSNQRGKGAVALLFSRTALHTLLASRYTVERPMDVGRGHKAIDGGIVTAMKREGWKEYVHNPSLVQHTGESSTMQNARHPKSPTFKGEEFDARELLR